MTRHRVGIRETALLAGLIIVVGFVALHFEFGGGSSSDLQIDLYEAIVIGACFLASVIYLGWRRIADQEREIARRTDAERRAHELAHTDALTGLANRRRFEDALKQAVASPPGAQSVHALVSLDLNGFKKINDVYGHPTGDNVLVAIAQRLTGAARNDDLLARLGGDEFAFIARHLAGPEAATSLALRVLKALESPISIGSVEHRVGAGVGLALIPRDGSDADEILRKADIALYRAKATKESTFRFFEEEMDRHSREREYLERELAKAIDAGAVNPWYQPIVDLKTREVIGFEALARWTHPELGEIAPDRFIPIAEDCGLIRKLSDHLLRRACTDAQRWPQHITLSVNISPAQLQEKTLGLRILNIIGETGLSPHRLEIEITESAIVRDLEAAKAVLSSLREAGIRIALDDFGTGYSSLYHLRNFKFDKIKIDRSFVETMDSEAESAAIVRALTGLGHGLGLAITAEGIEESDQRDTLLKQGCQQGQGFLFSRAIPAEETAALFRQAAPQTQKAIGVSA
jgi:diguanylate cyclase (GGDEF)-like protein